MKKIAAFTFIITCLFAFTNGVNKPNVLIIGDSISIGYTPYVTKYLEDKATIIHNKGNAQHTGTGLKNIEEWIGTEDWDIIQFNWGLWDLCYRHSDSKVQGKRDKVKGEITFTIDEYASNLDSLISIMQQKSKAKLVFVTTSYVPESESGRFVEDAIKYNEAAKEVMKKNEVVVNDIYEFSKNIHPDYGTAPNNVHYTKEGYALLGEKVANFLEQEIENLK